MSEQWSDIEHQLGSLKEVEGGFSQAQRGLVVLSSGQEVFVKVGLHENTIKWAKKEIAVYRFLEKHNYPHSPYLLSTNKDESGFAIQAFSPSEGWDWQDIWDEHRLAATLKACEDLAAIPLSEEERAFFSESGISQDDNGWQPLLSSEEKQKLLLQKLRGIGVEDVADRLDFPTEAGRSAKYNFSDDTLVHYDIRADNCAWNKATGQVKIVDWNWIQLGDRDLEFAATLSCVQKSGYDLPDEIVRQFSPDALHWIAGFWLNAATSPIWEDGPEHLRDLQLLFGVTALRLEQQHSNLS